MLVLVQQISSVTRVNLWQFPIDSNHKIIQGNTKWDSTHTMIGKMCLIIGKVKETNYILILFKTPKNHGAIYRLITSECIHSTY